ncbi:hypothetical protein Tco_1362788, partial [Tanacetum coccineum]
MRIKPFASQIMVLQLTDFTSEITDEELREFTSEYYIPSALHPVVPAADASIADFPVGKVGVYTRFFEFANQRVPLSLFMCNILNHYRLHISQLHCIGAAKISNFEVNCRLLAINPTVHLFRAFYHTCWSNGWVSFSKRAGRLQCYTEKLDALRRWREMFFWVDDALVPWNFAFYTQGLLPRDERPPPGSYSMEDAELINENRIPINAYSEAFLCHMGISRNYFQRPEEVPTFIGDDGREMDLFSVVHLSKPKQVTEGVRPLRDGEEPLLERTAGRTMELVLEQPEIESTDVLAPTPLRSVPSVTVEPPMPDATSIGSSEDADVAEVDSGLKRKRATGDDGAGPSKRVRHLSLGLSTSTEEESSGASPTLAAKEETETPPPNVEAISDSSAPVTHAAQSPPQTGPKAFDGKPVDQLVEEFDTVTAQQAALVAQLRAWFANERSRSTQKEKMDLFSVVHLSKPKQVTEGVRPLRDGEEPLLESTAGRTMELVLEQPEIESTDVLAPTPLRSVPSITVEPPMPDATSIGSSEDADVAEVDSGLKRKRATGDDGAGPSKRVRHLSLGLSTSTEEETPDASPTLAAKEVTETPPPNVEATSDSSAPVTHAAQSPPQTGPKAFEGMPVDQLMGEFDMVTAQQAALVAQLRARFSNERSQSIQKDEEILLLKTQLAGAQAEAESSRSYAQNLAEEKMALLVKVEQERADAAEYKASCHWAVKYLEGGKNNHFAGLDEFRQRVEGLLEKQEEKLRKLSIEYDEELYPHMLSAIAERRWLISHGLRLAAMSTLESQEVKQSFGDVVKCALARGKAEAVEKLHEKRLLTVPAAKVLGYNDKAYEELVDV